MLRHRSEVSLSAMAWASCASCILVLGLLWRITAVAAVTDNSSTNENSSKNPIETKIIASSRVADEGSSSGRFGGGFRNPNQDHENFKGTGQYDNSGQLNTNGIECYSCSNCATVNHLTPRKRCPPLQNTSKANKCVQFSQIYNALNGTWWVRGCPQDRGSCTDIQANLNHPSIVRVDTCSECQGDLCNSGFLGAPITTSMTTLAILTCLAKYVVS